MSDKTELLSAERLTGIQQDSEAALYWVGGQRYPTDDMAARAVNAVPDLLADREAFRRRVATELSRLLYLPELIEAMPPAAAHSARYQNLLTRTAATRLGLDLP